MTITERERPTARSIGVTPLGIFAAFVALSESVGGLAATFTGGGIQVAFTAFAVGFPVLVGVAFFMILWKRSYVLYPPQEFGNDVDVKQYVEAMRHQAVGTQEIVALIRSSIQGAISSPEARDVLSQVAQSSGPQSAEFERASAALTEHAVGHLEEAVVTVNVRAFSKPHVVADLVFRFNPEEKAFTFLSAIYFQICDSVRAFTYGLSWALQDAESNKLILPSNIDWSSAYAVATSNATVAELGLAAGMRLRAVRLSGQTTKHTAAA